MSFKGVIVKSLLVVATISSAIVGLNGLSQQLTDSVSEMSSERIVSIRSGVDTRSYEVANDVNKTHRLTDRGLEQVGIDYKDAIESESLRVLGESNKILQDALKLQYKNMFVAVSFTFLISAVLTVGLLKTIESMKLENSEKLMLKDESEKMDFREVISSFQVKLAELDAEIMDAKLASKK